MRERKEGKSRNATAGKVGTLMSALTKSLKNGGSDGARTRDLRRDRPAPLPTHPRPPGRVAELNTDRRRVKAAPEKPRSHGQISRFAHSARPLEPVIGRFPRTGIEKTHIFRQ